MTEIKPVYQQRREFDEWEDIPKDTYDMRVNGKYQVRILYPAAAYEALQKENAQWKTVLNSNEQIRVAQAKLIEEAVSRLKDILKNDDGQAYKEARKFIESLSASKNGE